MGIWDALGLTAGKALADPITAAGNALDKLFTSDDERLAWLNKYQEIQKELALAQTQTNNIEASNTNLFVSGWRPAVGWICCAALAWSFILHPMIIFILNLYGIKTMHVENDIADLTPILYGLLGIGGLRTLEKFKGVS